MSRSSRPLALLFTAALIAGCGGSSGSSDSPAPSQKTAPKTGNGELRVGVTDGGIGTATRNNKPLPNGAVKKPSNTAQGVGAGASCQNTDVAPSPQTMATVIASTLCLLNGERQDAGLAPLTENAKLASAAVGHSQDMVDQQYFDHAGKDGSDPVSRIKAAGYIPNVGAWTVGENLAWGTGTLATPKEIVQAWMKSQGHRDNILRSSFKEIGFGVVVGNPRATNGSGATYTTTFGGITGATAASNPSASTNSNATTPATSKAAKKKKKRKNRKARAAKRKRSTRPSGSHSSTKPSGSHSNTKPSGSHSSTKPSGSH